MNIAELAQRLVVAIDFGTTQIRAAVGLLGDDNQIERIVATEVEESKDCIRKGAVYNMNGAKCAVANIITHLENRLNNKYKEELETEERHVKFKIKGVCVGLNGDSINTDERQASRNLNGEIITEEMVSALENEVKSQFVDDKNEMLQMWSLEFDVDDQSVNNPIGVMGDSIVRAKYNTITAKKKQRHLLRDFLKELGITPKYVISPLAMSDILLSDSDKELGCALINIGAGVTSVSVYWNNMLRNVRVLPIGGDIITEDIKSLHFSKAVAEKLKKKAGSADPDSVKSLTLAIQGCETRIEAKELAKTIGARVDQIIGYTWGEINKVDKYNKITKVYLSGGTSDLRHIVKKYECETGFCTSKAKLSDALYARYAPYFEANQQEGVEMSTFTNCIALLEQMKSPCVEMETVAKPETEIKVPTPKPSSQGKTTDPSRKEKKSFGEKVRSLFDTFGEKAFAPEQD